MKRVKAGLMAVAMAGLLVLPVEESAAVTKCRETIVNGRVVKSVCTTKPRYRTVCNTYWRNGIKYQSCRKVKVY